MTAQTLAMELSAIFDRPERDIVQQGLLALIAEEILASETELAELHERYNVFTLEALHDAIQNGQVAGHPSWEDHIVWKNIELRRLKTGSNALGMDGSPPRTFSSPLQGVLLVSPVDLSPDGLALQRG